MPSSEPILKHCVVAIADDLEDYDWREEKVKQWVSYHGGKFSSTVDGGVTHLLCTEDNFKKKIAPVQAALKDKSTKIVLRDWLEDSINKKMCLKTQKYDLVEKFKHEGAKKRKTKEIEKNKKLGENYVDQRFWHVYRDSTYFEYQILLTRNDEEDGNVGEKHLLTLWESNAKPYNYKCTTLYTKKAKTKAIPFAFQDYPVDLQTAFKTFKSYFQKRTGIAWDDRIAKIGIVGSGRFQYQPPSGGKPVGLIKGRPASIFRGEGNGSRLVDPNKANEEKNDEHAVEETKGAEISRKRPRDEEVADHTTVNADDEQRPAKKSRQEVVQTAPVPAEIEVDATNHAIVADSDPERNEDIQHGQDYDELPPGEGTMRDAGGVNEIQLRFNDVIDDSALQIAGDYKVMQDASGVDGLQQEYDNMVNDGTLQITNDYEESQPGHNAAGEDNALQTINDNDGLAAPCNSDAGEEEGDDQTDAVDNAAQGNNDRAIINLTEIEDEIQVNEFNDGDGISEDVEAPEPISAEDRHARASAASIYDETNHGVDFVPNSQAALIDTVQEAKARVRARAKKRMERQDKLNAQLAVEPEPDSDVSEY